MDENHPALVAARGSWRCVQAKDKEGWLALMADDVLFEDPIGVGPTNPDGQGIRGKQALAGFFEKNMAPNTIRIETHESFAAGNESAHVMTLRTCVLLACVLRRDTPRARARSGRLRGFPARDGRLPPPAHPRARRERVPRAPGPDSMTRPGEESDAISGELLEAGLRDAFAEEEPTRAARAPAARPGPATGGRP